MNKLFENWNKFLKESPPGMEPYDLSALVPKGVDPGKRAEALDDGRSDYEKVGKPSDKWKNTRYYEYDVDAFGNAKEEDGGVTDSGEQDWDEDYVEDDRYSYLDDEM